LYGFVGASTRPIALASDCDARGLTLLFGKASAAAAAHRSHPFVESFSENRMKLIAAVVASLCMAGGAVAQGTSPANPGPSVMMKADAKRDAGVESHISDLRAKLKITPAEESKWKEVAATMRENAKDMDAAIDKRESAAAGATAIDDLNSYADIAQAHANGVKKLASVFSSLYSVMSDDQKKTADETFSHRDHAGRKVASR
jgi:protein CpxP